MAPELVRNGSPGVTRKRCHWSGAVGATFWFYFTGESTNEVWRAYLAHCEAMLDSGISRPSLVCICYRADSPNSEQRRMIANFITRESVRLSSLIGFALVLDSPLHIMALRAINWLVRKPFPETVCGSPRSAAMWLLERGAPLDLNAFHSALEEHVPREFHWKY